MFLPFPVARRCGSKAARVTQTLTCPPRVDAIPIPGVPAPSPSIRALAAGAAVLPVCPAPAGTAHANRPLPGAPVPGSTQRLRAKEKAFLWRAEEICPARRHQPPRCRAQGGIRARSPRAAASPIEHCSARLTAQVSSKSFALHRATRAWTDLLKNTMSSQQLIPFGRGRALRHSESLRGGLRTQSCSAQAAGRYVPLSNSRQQENPCLESPIPTPRSPCAGSRRTPVHSSSSESDRPSRGGDG